MSEKQQLIDELQKIYDGEAWHAGNLSEILAEISAEKALAKPIPSAHSIWEIALHMAAWNDTFAARLSGDLRVEPVDGDFPPIAGKDQNAWREALQKVKASHENLIEVIRTLDDASLPKQFADRDYTLSFFLHGIVRHIVYHSGQIAVLKKAEGKASSATP